MPLRHLRPFPLLLCEQLLRLVCLLPVELPLLLPRLLLLLYHTSARRRAALLPLLLPLLLLLLHLPCPRLVLVLELLRRRQG